MSARPRRSGRAPTPERLAVGPDRARHVPVVAGPEPSSAARRSDRGLELLESRASRRRARACSPSGSGSCCSRAGIGRSARRRRRRSRRRPGCRLDSERAGVLNRFGCALFALGREDEGRERMAESIEIAERTGFSDDIATAYLNFADALHLVGRGAEARRGRRAGHRAEVQDRIALSTGGSTRSMRFIRLNLAEIHFDLGEWAARRGGAARRPSLASRAWAWRTRGCGRPSSRLPADGEDGPRPRSSAAEELLTDALEPQYIAMLAVAAGRGRGPRAVELEPRRAAIDGGSTGSSSAARTAPGLALTAAAGRSGRGRDRRAGLRVDGRWRERSGVGARGRSSAELVGAAAEEARGPVEGAVLRVGRGRARPSRGRATIRGCGREAADGVASGSSGHIRRRSRAGGRRRRRSSRGDRAAATAALSRGRRSSPSGSARAGCRRRSRGWRRAHG